MARTDPATLLGLEALFNTAAAPAPDYTEALDGLRRHFNGSRACIQFFDGESIPTFCLNDANDTSFVDEAAEFELKHMPPIIPQLSAITGDKAYLQSRLFDDSALERSPVWHSVMRKRSMFKGIGWKFDFGHDGWCMVDIQRGRHQDDFSTDDFKTFRALGKTLRRTSSGVLRSAGREDEARRLRTLFDGLPEGMLTADAGMRIFDMNAAAAVRLIEAGFLVDDGKLAAGSADARVVLERIGEQWLLPEPRKLSRWRVRGKAGWFSLQAQFLEKGRFGRPLLHLVVTLDDRPEGDTVEQKLMAEFALTRREAAVAARIAHGLSPKQISREFGNSITTVRTQLASIFAKTGAAGQVQLALLVKRGLSQ